MLLLLLRRRWRRRRLRLILVSAAAVGRGRARVTDEQLVILARGKAVAPPRRLRVSIAGASALGIPIIRAWHRLLVGVLIWGPSRVRVRDVGIIVVLSVSVVRHGV
jgi:hypothetical protein